MASFRKSRRQSNELSASLRLTQLRDLQSQLSVMIQDAREIPLDDIDDEESLGSASAASSKASFYSRGPSVDRSHSRNNSIGGNSRTGSVGGNSWAPSVSSERASLLNNTPNNEVFEGDIESGMLPATYKPGSSKALQPRRTGASPLVPSTSTVSYADTLPIAHHRTGGGGGGLSSLRLRAPSSIIKSASPSEAVSLVMPSKASQASSLDVSIDEIDEKESNNSEETKSIFSTDPTVATSRSGNGGNNTLDGSERKSRWTRSREGARSLSRSLSRSRRSRSGSRSRGARSNSRSIFKGKEKGTTNGTSPTDNNQSASATSRQSSTTGNKTRLSMIDDYDFLSKEEDKDESSLKAGSKWWHAVFVFSLISMIACVITLWAPYPIGARMPTEMIANMPWSDGCKNGLKSCICPRETICADDIMSMIFLTIARSTAWFDYPLYMLLFMSKANNLNNFLQKTALRCWINFSDYHKVHSLFGMIVGLESTSHSFFHILRWARRNDDIQLLWTSRTGIAGLIAITITPFIVLPMTVPYLKQRMRFEWRKALHYLSIVWGAALMCHAPQRIFWLIGIPVFVYTADKMVEGLFKTHLVESCHFQRLGDTSCIISFENPPGFGKQNSAYVYLMLPWLSKYQFHAFTVFPCTKANHSSICIHKCGDWTGQLMKTITTPTHKPAFVVGPFLSPFSSPAMDSENLVALASGIGVTPAISLIKQYSSTSRRLNLVWICRDPGLVEHFLQNVEFGSDGYTLIYYTGKERRVILRDEMPPNMFMFNGRPNLERTISGIISSIATGEGLPEQLSNKVVTRTPAEMRSKLLLEKALSIYTVDQLYDYTVKASNHYNEGLEPLVNEVNYQGVLSTMRHLLGDDIEDVTDKVTHNFEKLDTNGDCRMDRDEFEQFFNLMLVATDTDTQEMSNIKDGLHRMNTCRDMFESSSRAKRTGDSDNKNNDEFGIKKHLQGDGKFSSRNWNMLYCGGSQPVLDQLKDFKRKFGIGLSVEKFDW